MISQGSIAWQELPDSIERDDFFYFHYDSRNFLLSDVALEKAFLTGKFELLLSRNFKYLKLISLINSFYISQAFSSSATVKKCPCGFSGKILKVSL